MESKEVVYEGYFAQPGHGGRKRLIRMLVDYVAGKIFVTRSESEAYHPTRVLASRFVEPDNDDWRAGHGVAFDDARKHLEDLIVMMGTLGYVESPGSPGWLKPLPHVFENYLSAERLRHPIQQVIH